MNETAMSQGDLIRVIAIFGGLFFFVCIVGFIVFVTLSKKEKAKRARDIELAKVKRPSSD